jgi:hypothetical protein
MDMLGPGTGTSTDVLLSHTLYMFETLATFHLLMSLLNVSLLSNKFAMLLTEAVFQLTMLPYFVVAVVGLATHAVTAAPMLPLVMAVCACATGRMRCAIIATATRRRRPLGSREAAVPLAQRGSASPTASATARNTHKVGRRCALLDSTVPDGGPRRRPEAEGAVPGVGQGDSQRGWREGPGDCLAVGLGKGTGD